MHYGISLQWGPEHAALQHDEGQAGADELVGLYDPKYKGKITVPDNPIQIADAALYLAKTQADLGITDPYELNQTQFDAAVNLLKQQRPLVKKYWALRLRRDPAFKNGDVDSAPPGRTRPARSGGQGPGQGDPEARARRAGRTPG